MIAPYEVVGYDEVVGDAGVEDLGSLDVDMDYEGTEEGVQDSVLEVYLVPVVEEALDYLPAKKMSSLIFYLVSAISQIVI